MQKGLALLLKRIKTGAKIIFKFILLLPIPAFFVWFNYTVDSSGFFHGEQFERDAALALLSGENIAGYEQLNEQKINSLFAKNSIQAPDTLALGSSRVLQLNEKIANSKNFVNFGVSGADLRDVIGGFYLFEKEQKLPKNLILELDPWLLNGAEDAYNLRSDVELYNEFLKLKLSMDVEFTPNDETAKYKALVSPSYFQGNLDYYFRGSSNSKTPTIVKTNLQNQTTGVKMADGSVLYPKDFREASLAEINQKANTEATTFMRMDGFTQPDPELTKIFENFVLYAQKQGVNVIFLLTPYHPSVYNYATENADKYTGFFKCEPYYTNFAQKHNIPVYGSYNPFVANCLEEYFYDGLHITGDGLSRIFPGVPAINKAQKSGNAGSPWVNSSPKVLASTAQYIVEQRYEIIQPNELRPAKNIKIGSEQCYLFEEYNSSEQVATMIAQFAVTQNEGIIYRFDTTNQEWVVDKRFV